MNDLGDLKSMKSQLTLLEQKFESFKSQIEGNINDANQIIPDNPVRSDSDIMELIREEREIDTRKTNLCVFNLPESDNDREMFTNLCSEQLSLNLIGPMITDTLRIGQTNGTKPKVLIVKFSSHDTKRNVLQNAPKLRNYVPVGSTLKVFISPDYTKKQQEFQKTLRNELRTRKENGEDVIIQKNKVVPRSQPRRLRE